MIQETVVYSMGEYIDFVTSLKEYNTVLKRNYNDIVFRGLKNSGYLLSSSLKRNCDGNELRAEKRMLINFEKYGQIFEPRVASSLWEKIVIAQHHGLPTRLIDWTFSPLVALHFATDHVDSGIMVDNDSAVWIVGVLKIHKSLPSRFEDVRERNQSQSYTCEDLIELNVDIESYDAEMKNTSFVFLEPPSIDMRIVNQGSIFSIVPNKIDPLDTFFETTPEVIHKVIIPKEKLLSIRDELDFIVNERILFPGLDGMAQWLRRRYYNRSKRT